MRHVVVLGAGYAGVMAANRLVTRGFPVTVVTPSPHFVERVRLHRVASGHRPDARVPMEKVLHPAAEVVIAAAQRIDASRRRVRLSTGGVLSYDWLVYAVGSGDVPSEDSRIHHVVSEGSTHRLRDALALRPDAPVTVIGAGLTGIEVACALSTAGRQVGVIARDLHAATRQQRAYARRMEHLGVGLRLGRREDVDLDAGIVVDATGLAVPRLAQDSGLPVDESGRLDVDRDLRVRRYSRIVGAGDAVRVRGREALHLRKSCATALPMGTHAARVIEEMREGAPTSPFLHSYAIQCVDLGGGRGHVQFVTGRDTPLPAALGSVLGAAGKELVLRGTVAAMQRGARRRPRWCA